MPFPKQSVDPPPEVDEHGSLGSDYADAIRMGRWVVVIVAVLVAAMLAYDYTSYSTVANLVPFSHPLRPVPYRRAIRSIPPEVLNGWAPAS